MLRFYISMLLFTTTIAEFSDTDLNDLSEKQNAIKVSKCCEDNEIIVDSVCRLAEKYNQNVWKPQFKNSEGLTVKLKYYQYVHGIPNCETTQQRPIFDLNKSEDELNLLKDGQLQHLIHHEHATDNIKEESTQNQMFSLHDPVHLPEAKEPASYIHVQDKYCLDKILMTATNSTGLYALVCVPEVKVNWRDTSFLMKKVLNPLFHGIAIIFYLLVAIIYFVLPTLRDLAGNILTTICVCLVISQASDLIRIFTEANYHISFMITDIALYISILSAFFWLNGFGFYIWKTFKSRNVFLRVTDVRKYCYYSSVIWSIVSLMTLMAICAHFLLDNSNNPNHKMRTHFSSSILIDDVERETIGWLGVAIFFTPIAFTIIINIFFYATTLNVIKRINIYGRIHHKLKGCFDLFLQMCLIMTTGWIFQMLSWIEYEGLLYVYIFINLFQAVLIFYVCVMRQSHVLFLLRKCCCYSEPVPTGEWGDEMTHMNGSVY